MSGAAPEPNAPATRVRGVWLKVAVYIGIIALWYGALQVLPLDTWLLNVLAWVEAQGYWGPLIFILLYIPACVFMFPDVLPNAAAGAIWGIGVGAVTVSVGRLLGSAATFLLTRTLAGGWSERRIAADPKLEAVAEAVGRQGFRIVLLLRLCPLFPVIMLNYMLGLTRVNLGAYMLGTFIGLLPRTVLVAYVGSGARSLMDLTSGTNTEVFQNPLLYWGGLGFTVIIVFVLGVKARKIINDTTRIAGQNATTEA